MGRPNALRNPKSAPARSAAVHRGAAGAKSPSTKRDDCGGNSVEHNKSIGAKTRMRNPVRQTLMCGVAAVLFASAGVLLATRLWPWPPPPNAALHEALGAVLAHQALGLLGPGGRLILVARDTTEIEAPAARIQVRAFEATCQRAGRPVALRRLIRVDPLRPVAVPPGDFFELLRKTSTNDVVVSFMGPPALTGAQAARLPRAHARVVALCTGPIPNQVDLRRLFAQDLLHVAVLDRREAMVTALRPTSHQGWFNLFYRLVTSNNVAELPAPASAGL